MADAQTLASNATNVYSAEIAPEVTGHSTWKGFKQILDDPDTGRHEISWSAASGTFLLPEDIPL